MTDKIKGGLADGKSDSKYPKDQLKAGIKVEMEHTDDPAKAKEIAKDHLEEGKDYYTRLEKMERGMKKSAFFIGFEKRAYDYDWEAKAMEKDRARRQHETPTPLGKAMGVGAGLGGLAGLGLGALHAGKAGLIGGGLAGLGVGSLLGAGAHLGQKNDIADAKYVMGLDPDLRTSLLRSRAREDEISSEEERRSAALQSVVLLNHMLEQQRAQHRGF
jgi:hypothetical protein